MPQKVLTTERLTRESYGEVANVGEAIPWSKD
jgi:hypothetical protein